MRLYMDQKRASGQQKVVLTGRGSRTTGSAFDLDLQTNTATLKGDVVTHYE
jgi:lipopolysaccharide export system protein LptC